MDCATEEQIIQNRLNRIKEVQELEFDLMNRVLSVRHTLGEEGTLTHALNSIGMAPEPLAPGQSAPQTHGPGCCDAHGNAAPTIPPAQWWLMGTAGTLALASEITAWVSGNEQSPAVIVMALASIALGGRETLRKGIIAAKTFTLNINFLMTLAVIGAAIIGEWPEAAMVVVLFGVAEMIESLSLDRARNAIRSLMQLSPDVAWVRNPQGEFSEVPAAQVRVGDTVRVRPGERIPLDGLITSGSSAVDQAPITGESIPVAKAPGDTVFAGTVNGTGAFEFEVTANTGETTLARIVRAVQQAQGKKAPTQRFVDQFARIYTPIVVALAVLVAAIPPLILGQPFQEWLYRALVLLVIACPCALVISTPVTIVSALATAARRGILVKGGIYIEEGRRLGIIALDKTGTLTQGKPQVTDVIPLGAATESEVLRRAASLNAYSEHPVAGAIVAAYSGRPGLVSDFQAIAGKGVRGVLDGKMTLVGSLRLAEAVGAPIAVARQIAESLRAQGKTIVVLADESTVQGIIAVADTLRETSVQAIDELHQLGVKSVILTGDNQQTAQAIAQQVGIDDARGDLLPEQKLDAIESLLEVGNSVGMVGEGINDAPALARASIGFAMGTAGTDTAIETADVALMNDDLRKVPEFIRLSHRATHVLKQNIAIAIGIKVVFFALALGGIATLWMAVFADMGASLIVVGNGLRLLRTRRIESRS